MSLGVACFPEDATVANDLIHEADVAVYQAKLRGHNCVACASEVPHSVELDSAPLEDRLTAPCVAAFVPRPEPAKGSVGPSTNPHAEAVRDEAAGTREGQARRYPRELLWLFVVGVILLGVGLSILAFPLQPKPDLAAMGLLTALAVRAQLLQVKNLPLPALFTFAAALLYSIIETGFVATAISPSEGSSIVTTCRERYRWLAEHYVVLGVTGLFLSIVYTGLGLLGIIVFALALLIMHCAQRQYIERTERSVRELGRMKEELSLANREVIGASQAIQQLNQELVLTIGKIADARDPSVSSHAGQVAEYAASTAIELGLPAQRVVHLRRAGLLDDVGKIGIPERILHKPGSLTPEEYEQFKAHTALGGEFLQTCQGPHHPASFIRQHHERLDGGGYADGLPGEEIPLEARILAACNAVEAMASDRPYRRAMPLNEVISELRRCAGTQFDPAVVEACCRVSEREAGRIVTNSAQKVMREHADKWEVMAYELPAPAPA